MKQHVEAIIRGAGDILLSYFGKLHDREVDQKALHDYVTVADKSSENYILSQLKNLYPEIDFFAEESGKSFTGTSSSYWIIDPLDGTKNFIQSIPYFAISIALMKENDLVFGMVFDPVHNELFYAEKEKGSFLNNRKTEVSSLTDFSRGFISTGFPFKKRSESQAYMRTFADVFSEVTNIRRCGAAALDLAYLSAGRYDGFFELGLSPWDIAAGALLITEAGGKITDFNGSNAYLEQGNIVAGNTRTHQKLLTLTQKYFKAKDL